MPLIEAGRRLVEAPASSAVDGYRQCWQSRF